MTTNKTKSVKSKTYYCDRNLAFYNVSPWTRARLNNFFNWIEDDPTGWEKDKKRLIQGLKNWKASQDYRLSPSDKMAIDYVLKCYS